MPYYNTKKEKKVEHVDKGEENMGVYVKDIEMPANCCKCIFESINGDMADYYWYCCAVKDRPVIDDDIRRTARMKWCPLMDKTEI